MPETLKFHKNGKKIFFQKLKKYNLKKFFWSQCKFFYSIFRNNGDEAHRTTKFLDGRRL